MDMFVYTFPSLVLTDILLLLLSGCPPRRLLPGRRRMEFAVNAGPGPIF